MKRPFQVGDRVAVYGWAEDLGRGSDGQTVFCNGTRGVFQKANKDDPSLVTIKPDQGAGYLEVHPQQLRRLIKKERKVIYVTMHKSGIATGNFNDVCAGLTFDEQYVFVEHRPKRKP